MIALVMGIWTVHFFGMLAVPLSADAALCHAVDRGVILLCALIVGVCLFLVRIGESSL